MKKSRETLEKELEQMTEEYSTIFNKYAKKTHLFRKKISLARKTEIIEKKLLSKVQLSLNSSLSNNTWITFVSKEYLKDTLLIDLLQYDNISKKNMHIWIYDNKLYVKFSTKMSGKQVLNYIHEYNLNIDINYLDKYIIDRENEIKILRQIIGVIK